MAHLQISLSKMHWMFDHADIMITFQSWAPTKLMLLSNVQKILILFDKQNLFAFLPIDLWFWKARSQYRWKQPWIGTKIALLKRSCLNGLQASDGHHISSQDQYFSPRYTTRGQMSEVRAHDAHCKGKSVRIGHIFISILQQPCSWWSINARDGNEKSGDSSTKRPPTRRCKYLQLTSVCDPKRCQWIHFNFWRPE